MTRGSKNGIGQLALTSCLALASPVALGQGLSWWLDGEARNDWAGQELAVVEDVDGDGAQDVLIGVRLVDGPLGPSMGRAYLVSGANGTLLHAWDGEMEFANLGTSVAGAGDVDDDGVGDVLIGAPSDPGVVYVMSGRSYETIHRIEGTEHFGRSVAGGADLDGDSHADFVVGQTAIAQASPADGKVWAYSGVDGAVLWVRETEPDGGGEFGYDVAIIPDLDGDGFDEVLASDPEFFDRFGPGRTGRIYIFSGATGASLHQWSGDADDTGFGKRVVSIGDLDDDGSPDLLVSSPDYSAPNYSYAGRVQVLSSADGTTIHEWFGEYKHLSLGEDIASVADLNGDGRDEIAIGVAGFADSVGRADLYSGETGQLLWSWRGEQDSSSAGTGIAAGDLNGDGTADLLVGAPYFDRAEGPAANYGRIYAHTSLAASGPSLEVGPITRGQPVTIDVSGAQAGETLRILSGVVGRGPRICPNATGGRCLDLRGPIEPFATVVADATGSVQMEVETSTELELGELFLQLAAVRGTGGTGTVLSDVVSVTVSE